VFRRLLTELEDGVVVLEAGDCDGTCRLIEQHPDLDLVLFDLRLPGAAQPLLQSEPRSQELAYILP
jgi:CheY-like chemotaxis protein